MTLFISPPFGNYLNLPNTIPIRGSFTLHPRNGLFMQILKTLRYDFENNCWRNKIGLRNPGIEVAISKYYIKKKEIDNKNNNMKTIVSIAILNKDEITPLNEIVPRDCNIELNVSCPNVDEEKEDNFKTIVYKELGVFYDVQRKWCIVKLSPHDTIKQVDTLYKQGFRQFHCSNTLPKEDGSGGLSGHILRPYTSKLVKTIKNKYPDTEIIAGGGIRNYQDIASYKQYGANHFSISSLCFNPFMFYIFYVDHRLRHYQNKNEY
jgi:dihydroorotate dehydrogenase